jgi:protein-S-isoprenylcysteine O-methyltransferase Ste14
MSQEKDAPDVVIEPPIALAIAVAVSLGLTYLRPLPFVPPAMPHIEAGLVLFLVTLLVIRWSAATFRKAGTQVLINRAATAIVDTGPYRYSRNPIYVALFLGLVALAIGFDSLWFLAALVVIYFVIRYGVVAREEVYLERKFGAQYLDYKARVRRWL